MSNEEFAIESYVDAERVAEFLSTTRRSVLRLARAATPGHPLGSGQRSDATIRAKCNVYWAD
jgi:hypothetical protein